MDLGMQLILLIIFGIIGFITDKIWRINPYKIFSDISAALLLLSFMFFISEKHLNLLYLYTS